MMTRRATQTIQSSMDLLDYHLQKKPESLDELYNKTLPEMRSKLKRQSLKQAGMLRPITQDEFEKHKYQMINDQHDPYHPKAIVDPTLNHFRPKQLVGKEPEEAKDDLLLNAIKNLHVDLKIPDVTIGNVIEYNVTVTTISDEPLDLIFAFVLSHPATSRVISYSERKVRVQGKKSHSVQGNFGVETSAMVIGTYRMNCRIYLGGKSNKQFLSSFGPIEFNIVQSHWNGIVEKFPPIETDLFMQIVLAPQYAYVIFSFIASIFTLLYLGGRVMSARKKYGVDYPHM